jgi:arylamine N-acetyltransferase
MPTTAKVAVMSVRMSTVQEPGHTAQVHLEGQWWAADVGFGSQVPRQPVPLKTADHESAPEQSGMYMT